MSVEDSNIPPVPNQSPIEDFKPEPIRFGVTWSQWFEAVRSKVNILNASLVNIAKLTTSGLVVHNGDSWETRSIKGVTGEVTVTNGDGIAGDPTIGLADTSVTPGTYSNVTLTVDSKGRITDASTGAVAGRTLPMTNGETPPVLLYGGNQLIYYVVE